LEFGLFLRFAIFELKTRIRDTDRQTDGQEPSCGL